MPDALGKKGSGKMARSNFRLHPAAASLAAAAEPGGDMTSTVKCDTSCCALSSWWCAFPADGLDLGRTG